MIRVVIFSVICLAIVMAGTTTTPRPHHSHPTREPSEHDTFRFMYEPQTHHMLLLNGQACYIFTLTDDERIAVHSDTGIAALEMKFLTALTTATMKATTEDQLSKYVQHACGHHVTTYYTVAV